MHYTLGLQMCRPSLRFLSIRNLESDVINPDAPFIERSAHRYVVSHHRDDQTGGMHQGDDIKAVATTTRYDREAHDVPAPRRCSLTIRDRQIDVGEALAFRHGHLHLADWRARNLGAIAQHVCGPRRTQVFIGPSLMSALELTGQRLFREVAEG